MLAHTPLVRLAPCAQPQGPGGQPGVDLGLLRLPADVGDVLVHEPALRAAGVLAEAHPQPVVVHEVPRAVDRLVPGRRALLGEERTHCTGVLRPDEDEIVAAHERPRVAAALGPLLDEGAQVVLLAEHLVPEELEVRVLPVVDGDEHDAVRAQERAGEQQAGEHHRQPAAVPGRPEGVAVRQGVAGVVRRVDADDLDLCGVGAAEQSEGGEVLALDREVPVEREERSVGEERSGAAGAGGILGGEGGSGGLAGPVQGQRRLHAGPSPVDGAHRAGRASRVPARASDAAEPCRRVGGSAKIAP